MFSFQGKKILIISPEPWNHLFVSKHHYALVLSKLNAHVYFLNPPSTRLSIHKVSDSLKVVDYRASFIGLRFLPPCLVSLLTRNEFLRLQKQLEATFDIIWNFDPSRFFDLSLVGTHIIKIGHIVDYNQFFQRNTLARTVDLCFCTTDIILSELRKYNNHSYKIFHGYSNVRKEITSSFNKGTRKAAMYIGNLSIRYIDWETLYKSISECPEVDFHFFGADTAEVNKWKQQVKKLENSFFPGKVDSSIIPNLLEKADVLLLCYQSENFRKQLASPHKMLEYLGSGKVIVSTYTEEYKDKRHLIEMVDHNSEFSSRLRQVLDNLDSFNNDEKRLARKDFAQSNSYSSQIAKIEKIIDTHVI